MHRHSHDIQFYERYGGHSAGDIGVSIPRYLYTNLPGCASPRIILGIRGSYLSLAGLHGLRPYLRPGESKLSKQVQTHFTGNEDHLHPFSNGSHGHLSRGVDGVRSSHRTFHGHLEQWPNPEISVSDQAFKPWTALDQKIAGEPSVRTSGSSSSFRSLICSFAMH